MFEQTFKNIDDILHKDAGCGTELDYTEQSSWLLFLKYLDALENQKAMAAELEGKKYSYILDPPYRWEAWAAPKGRDGKIDHNSALTGEDLREFVNAKLIPYLHGFKQKAERPDSIEYKIGEIFGEIKNKLQSGYSLRGVIDLIDELRFGSQAEKHELSHLYEAKIKNMGNAGRNGGEYYTPRPLIRAMIQVTAPTLGETVYDAACGSAGFLCESYEYLRPQVKNAKELKQLQESTFYGKEKKSLAYVIAIMNMILHGIEAPNIVHTNTLAENIADIQEKDRFDVILANPPFGGKEHKQVQQNFPIRTGETAFLFMQHFIKSLKAGGRAAIVIKNTFLSNTDNASVSLRKLLLESCNLHTILDCPGGTFQGAGVKTVVLFFEKGAPTRKTWFYQLEPGRNMGKTNPLNDADLAEFVQLQKSYADSDKSWSVDANTIDADTFDLSVKNPNGGEVVAHRSPESIMAEITALDAESAEVLENIRSSQLIFAQRGGRWMKKRLDSLYKIGSSKRVLKSEWKAEGVPFYRGREVTRLAADGFVENELFISEKHFSELSEEYGVPKADDIVITAIGTIGNSHVVRNSDRFYFKDASVLWMKRTTEVSSEFIKFWLKSSLFFDQLDRGNGATVDTLTIQKLQSVELCLPSHDEQLKIADQLNVLSTETQRLESIYKQKIAALDELKKALLHKAFAGEL